MSKLVLLLFVLPAFVLTLAVGAAAGILYKGWTTPDLPDGQALRLPSEIKVKAGRAAALAADTVGRRVKFACATDLEMVPRDEKSCWVFGVRPGRYQVMAWSAVGEYPTDHVTCTVVVEGDEPPAPKSEDKQANLEARR